MAQDDARRNPVERQALRQLLLELPEVAQSLDSILAEAAEAGATCVLATEHGDALQVIAGSDAVAIAVTEQRLDPAGHGLPSTMSIALPIDAGRQAVLIAYRRRPDGFDDRLRRTLQLLANRAAGVLEMVHRLSTARPTRLLADRNRLDTAVGVLMATHGCNPLQAMQRLQDAAMTGGISLDEAAEQVLVRLDR